MSGASVSSMGSAVSGSSASEFNPQGEAGAPGEDEIFEEPHHIQQRIFGVLYSVCKEHYMKGYGSAVFRLCISFLQLWLLVVNPAYGFDIDPQNPAWKAVSLINLHWFLAQRGYTFYLVLFYMFVGLLMLNVALSIWVAHQYANNRTDQAWPIVFLRWFGLIFYQVLDVASLTLLLVALDCMYFDVPKDVQFHNQLFPSEMCWSMPHLIHVAVAVVAIIVFLAMAGATVVGQMDLNPMTLNVMGLMHTRVEGYSFIIKAIATIASVTINSPKWLGIVYIACFATLLYLHHNWVPFTFAVSNHLRSASYAAVLYSAVLLVVIAFGSPADPEDRHTFSHNVTIALWAGLVPSALLGAVACGLRLRQLGPGVAEELRDLAPGTNTKHILKLQDAREVEIILRNTRVWLDEDTPDPEAVKLGEALVKAGLQQLHNNPQMLILYASYLIDIQGSYQSGYTQLQEAKKQSPGLLERFAIFSREQDHTHKASSGAAGGKAGAVDLASYVEFQRNHRLVTRAHKEALLAVRAFWGLLMHTSVNFTKLTKALERIEVTVRAAEKAYRRVLSRQDQSSSARLIRLYGKFLEGVKFDPWAAAKWFAEAERLDELEELARDSMQLGGGDVDLGGKCIVEGVAVVFIDSQGCIQMASPEVHTLLGYSKGELKGRDLGVILPPPFGEKHQALVRNYITTGVSHGILDHTNEFVAISKTRGVVPVRLKVSKVSGLSEDSVFMGTLEAVPNPPHTACAWLLGGGGGGSRGGGGGAAVDGATAAGFGSTLIAADGRFLDWLGYEASELVGQAVVGLLEDEELLSSAFKHLWNLHQGMAAGRAAAAGRKGGGRRTSVTGRYGSGRQQQQVSLLAPGGMTPTATLMLGWKHKYSGIIRFKTHLKIGAIGSVKHMTVTMEADWQAAAVSVPRPGRLGLPTAAEAPSALVLVLDSKGKVLHTTAALAAALGRTQDSIRQGGFDMLLPEPYTSLHGPWLSALAMPPGQAVAGELDATSPAPPHSCRSGVAVSLCGFAEVEGPVTRPLCMLRMQHRILPGKGLTRVHVLSLEQLSKNQVAAHRRLKLAVDMNGGITGAEDAPAELFGVDPRALVGKALADLVDLFRATGEQQGPLGLQHTANSSTAAHHQGGAAGGDKAAFEDDLLLPGRGMAGVLGAADSGSSSRQATKMLLELARRSHEAEGISWRVGVTLPPEPQAIADLAELERTLGRDDPAVATASRLVGGRVVPAVMRVRLLTKRPSASSGGSGAERSSSSSSGLERDNSFGGGGGVTAEESGGGRGSGAAVQTWTINWTDQATMPIAVGGERHRRSSVGDMQPTTPQLLLSPFPPAIQSPLLRPGLDCNGGGGVTFAHSSSSPAASDAAANAAAECKPRSQQEATSAGSNTAGSLLLPAMPAAGEFAKAAAADSGTATTRSSDILFIEVELWRADLLTGVVEVDESGRVLRIDPTDDLGQAALVLGAAKADLAGCNINSLLPFPAEQGGFIASLYGGGGGGGAAGAPLRGALKGRKKSREQAASAPCVLAAQHMGDGCVAPLRLQAVKRSGPYGTYYIMLRPEGPKAVQPGFVRWLMEGDSSGLARRSQLGMIKSTAAADLEGRASTSLTLIRGEASLMPFGGSVANLLGAAAVFDSSPFETGSFHARTNAAGGALGLAAGAIGGGPLRRVASGRSPAQGHSLLTTALATRASTTLGLSSPAPAAVAAVVMPPPPLSFQPALSGGLENLSAAPTRYGAPGASNGTSRFAAPAATIGEEAVAQLLLPNTGSGGGEDDSAMSAAGAVAAAANADPMRIIQHGESNRGKVTSMKDGPQPMQARKGKKNAKLSAVSTWVMSGGDHMLAKDGDGDLGPGPQQPRSGSAVADDGQQSTGAADSNGDGNSSSDGSGSGDRLSSNEGASGAAPLENEADADARVRQGLLASGFGGGGSRQQGGWEDGGGSTEGHKRQGGAVGDEASAVEDEAGAHVSNYGAGKRFKKLYKLLMSPQAQRPSWVLQVQALAVVGLLMLAHTVTFTVMTMRLNIQQDDVTDLSSMGTAATRVHEIALRCRTLAELIDNRVQQQAALNLTGYNTDPTPLMEGVHTFGEPYNESVSAVLDLLEEAVLNLKILQNGIYLGFNHASRVPTQHGLRDVWEAPRINITKYYDANDEAGQIMAGSSWAAGANLPVSITVKMSLWDAGNLFVSQALEITQNAIPIIDRGVNFKTWSAYLFIVDNGLDDIWPAYLDSMDAMVQILVDDGQQIYNIQLMMVCLEGGLVLVGAVIYMWWATQKFVGTRHALYSVFVQLPMGLTRTLANMSIALEPGEEDDDEVALGLEAAAAAQLTSGAGGGGDDGDAGGDGGGHEGAASGTKNAAGGARTLRIAVSAAGADGGDGPTSAATAAVRRRVSLTAKSAAAAVEGDGSAAAGRQQQQRTTTSGLASFLGRLVGRASSKVQPVAHPQPSKKAAHKRCVVPSRRVAVLLVLPFVVWGVILVVVNVAGFAELSGNNAAIASLSVLHTVVVRLHRILYYSLDLAASFGSGAERVGGLKAGLRHELQDATLEYTALLYGHEALAWAGGGEHARLMRHLDLAPEGIAYSGDGKVTQVVFKTRACLCELPEECQPPDSPYYAVTRNGVDVLAKAQFLAVESLLNQNPPDPAGGINSTEFRFMWSTFETDVEGGVDALLQMYLEHVQHAYKGIWLEQVIVFVLGWAWAFIFITLILRPFLRRTHLEMRRIAELLSHLPAEVDVEGMVAQVVVFGTAPGKAPITAGGAGSNTMCRVPSVNKSMRS
ncbi:hypothetical protein HXX76_000139 [Chlamydomonas incerta]|uniref:PAS domain-containing protein n=1 Tax=Chlamydomonas incerta TaxID=51695 RepID=A0A836B2M3_CHLIN|nr:hypothetical protein HXX76_000139 [Chlamydomonas incerta]|eukprot:KAG2445524.1 hypothetical protein HXX76_000139 [Chlamydomonas incerta]